MSATLKILVCYHKPAKLYKDDIYIPIHLGRALATEASQDGKMSNEDYQWMLDNMIGDDTGDNISHLNRYFCELTAIYWAWKNYDKLGNPDYIGLMHYRRIFEKQDIEDAVNYDITAPFDKAYDGKNIGEQFSNVHHTEDLNEAINLLGDNYAKIAQTYLQQKNGYYYNMFIMKKEIFFEYCEYLFKALLSIHHKTDYETYTLYNQRMPRFVAERLTGIFITEKEKHNKIHKVSTVFSDVAANMPVKPIFRDAVCICLSSDDNYAQYLGVTIASIKANKKATDTFDICVLDGGISFDNKKKTQQLADNGFSIRFIDISGFLADIDTKIFSLNAHFTIATYFRFFIPQIFAHYEKVLYFDCDLVVNADVAELFYTDMENYALEAVYDIDMTRRLATDKFYDRNIDKYLTNVLKMEHPTTYFQAGVLLLDITKLKNMDFTNKCLECLKTIQEPMYVDQCVLNSLFDGNYKKLDMRWNVLWQLPYYVKDLDRQLPVMAYKEYFEARTTPFIIHYASAIKPWKNPEIELADIWWKYARQTPFYEEILCDLNSHTGLLRTVFNYKKDKVRYLKYKLLSKITFGKTRKHYKSQKKELKTHLKEVKSFLKGIH